MGQLYSQPLTSARLEETYAKNLQLGMFFKTYLSKNYYGIFNNAVENRQDLTHNGIANQFWVNLERSRRTDIHNSGFEHEWFPRWQQALFKYPSLDDFDKVNLAIYNWKYKESGPYRNHNCYVCYTRDNRSVAFVRNDGARNYAEKMQHLKRDHVVDLFATFVKNYSRLIWWGVPDRAVEDKRVAANLRLTLLFQAYLQSIIWEILHQANVQGRSLTGVELGTYFRAKLVDVGSGSPATITNWTNDFLLQEMFGSTVEYDYANQMHWKGHFSHMPEFARFDRNRCYLCKNNQPRSRAGRKYHFEVHVIDLLSLHCCVPCNILLQTQEELNAHILENGGPEHQPAIVEVAEAMEATS